MKITTVGIDLAKDAFSMHGTVFSRYVPLALPPAPATPDAFVPAEKGL